MADFLTAYSITQPSKPAVIDDRPDGTVRQLTYLQLNEQANQLANVLLGMGVVPGDSKVVWCGQNSIGLVVMMNAARKLGVTAVPLNYRLSDEEAAYVTDHCDATIVYVDAEFAPMFTRIRKELPQVQQYLVFDGDVPEGMIAIDPLVAAASTAEPEIPEATEPGSTMIYTSGTTGKPKGALRRGTQGAAQGAALLAHIGYSPDDVYVPTGPLYHSGPGGFMGIALALGQTAVLQRKFNPEDWLRLVQKYKVTSTFSAPTPIRMICNLPDDVKEKYDVSSMKRMIANAAPWSFALKQMYLAYFPGDSLFEVYGSTELGVNCVLRPEDQLRKPGSCGQPAPMVDIKLFDDEGNEVVGVGPEHTGELFVRSPSVFADYYKQDMIISGGMNIYPAEIEAALEHHADVLEVAVFGVPSEEWGETVHAVVVVREGGSMTTDDVVAFAKEHLAGYKVPRSVTFIDELPKTGSGKVLKRELRSPFWAGRDSQV